MRVLVPVDSQEPATFLATAVPGRKILIPVCRAAPIVRPPPLVTAIYRSRPTEVPPGPVKPDTAALALTSAIAEVGHKLRTLVRLFLEIVPRRS